MSANDYDDFDDDPRGGGEQIAAAKLLQLEAENERLRSEIARGRGLTPEEDRALAVRVAGAKSADEVRSLLIDHGVDTYLVD